jgi:carbamoyltransferase
VYILGISGYYHDSAAALLKDGQLVAACAEERLSGLKHDSGFPEKAIKFCLDQSQINPAQIDHVVFYDRPLLKFDRIITSLIRNAPINFHHYITALPVWLRQKLWIKQRIHSLLGKPQNLYFSEHHLSHAAGAFFLSPYDKAAILTVDGVGERATASIGRGERNRVELIYEMQYPDSVGLLYSAFTYFLGFRVNSGEYKVMGLAPYGKPRFEEMIKTRLVTVFNDGSIKLNLKMYNFERGLTMTSKRFEKLFGIKRRLPGEPLEDIHRDIAASIQAVIEEVIINMARYARNVTGLPNLVLSGGVALNCKAIGLLRQSNMFDNIFVQPAAGDDGGALGAALFIYHQILNQPRCYHNNIISLGPHVDSSQIIAICNHYNIPYHLVDDFNSCIQFLARELAEDKIIGLVQGGCEFGPRALGYRSILANPGKSEMKAKINSVVKFREPFRPFAPVVVEEKTSDYFDCDKASPFMTFLCDVYKEKKEVIPAVTHVDNTSRIQTVSHRRHSLLYKLLQEFEKISGYPVLLNTSYNLRGLPISATADQVLKTFLSSGVDILMVQNIIIKKEEISGPLPSELIIVPGED